MLFEYFSQLAFAVFALARPTVDLGYATFEGVYDGASNTTSFLGVRYAAPPTGELRWQPPRPPLLQHGVQQAKSQPPMCVQGPRGQATSAPPFARGEKTDRNDTLLDACALQGICPLSDSTPPADSEDCLFLNVWTSGNFEGQTKTSKPVLVWIHGGGYGAGGATGLAGVDVFDGKYPIIRAQGDLVVVVIQYRLGMYGFLAGSDVQAAGAANLGLIDQQFALQWVQQYIHKFGGNPSDVTIWGESAGAGSVYEHVLANGGKTSPPLFNTAITSSNYLPPHYDVQDPIPEAIYDEVIKQAVCKSEADALECLRKTDDAVLRRINADIAISAYSDVYIFMPVVDHTFIQQAPTQAIAQGKVNGKHLLSVNNADEGRMFINITRLGGDSFDAAEWLRNTWPRLTDAEIAGALAQYSELGPVDQAIEIDADVDFNCPSFFLMRAFDKPYKAEFAIDNALHGYDLPYYFPDVGKLFAKSYNNTDFDTAFASAFTNFILAKDPNVKVAADITPAWPSWSDEAPLEMVFNKTEDGIPDVQVKNVDSKLLERCSYWQRIASSIGQ
ncbi:alpha/beta-hydrolase [Schizophyllum commune Tattone D]|nr:alpha/beta-hydrolase [Schizophyllum commune Tattone D]